MWPLVPGFLHLAAEDVWGFIYIIACVGILFLFMVNDIPLYVYAMINASTHPLMAFYLFEGL